MFNIGVFMTHKHGTLFGNTALTLTALIWGSSFVSQKASMDLIGPFTFLTSRSLLAFIFLLIVIIVKSRFNLPVITTAPKADKNPSLIKGGVICGCVIFLAAGIQQVGIVHTSASKAGFITAIYVVFVPILGVFLKHKIQKQIWFSISLVAIGLYLLCITESFSMNRSDILVLVGSLFWGIQIMVVDYYSPNLDCIKLSCIQFATCFVLSSAVTLVTETPDIHAIFKCGIHIIYAGVFASGIAFTLQMVGQKFARASVACIIMSLESVFAAFSGMLLLGESLTLRESIGCILVFLAIITAQVPFPPSKKVD